MVTTAAKSGLRTILGLALLGLIAGPLVAWAVHLSGLLSGCADGLGNPGIIGRLDGGACVLPVDDGVALRLDWTADLVIAVALAVALLGTVLSLALPRWRAAFAVVPIPALLVAGLPLGGRAWGERAMDRIMNGLSFTPDAGIPERYGVTGHVDGWLVTGAARDVLVPEPAGHWFLVSFAAGLVALAYLVTALRD